MKQHIDVPKHVMLGGGDQIYCDGLSKSSKLFKASLHISNLHHKFSTPYTEELKNEVEEFYLEHYCKVNDPPSTADLQWFHQGKFSHGLSL